MSDGFLPKDYIDVQQRINRFWSEYPDGRIVTNLMSDPGDFTQCRYVAKVYRVKDDPEPTATGWAFEIAGGKGANRTSHEENCETSAIGRALANMGYATSGKDRPSQQEMTKAARPNAPQARDVAPRAPQPAKEQDDAPITTNALRSLSDLAKRRNITNEDLDALVLWSYNADLLSDLTIAQGREVYTTLDKKNPSELAELIRQARAAVDDDNMSTQAMIDDFNDRYPPADLAAKHRGDR